MKSRVERGYNSKLDWRREKIQELSSQGHSQREIASIMHIGLGTTNRDISYLREQSKNNIKKYVDEKLPEEYEKCLVGLTAILKEAWNTAQTSQDKREKIQALSLAKDCYSMKLELLTNATVVDDALKFVTSNRIQTEKAKTEDKSKDIDKGQFDIQGSPEDNNESAVEMPTNQTF